MELRFLRLDLERHPVDAGDEIDLPRVDQAAVGEQANRRRLRDARADLRRRLDRLADSCRRRRAEPLDEDLVATGQPHDTGLDLDSRGRGERRLVLAAARRVVAVRQQDDPLLGVVGEERRREAERGPDVRRGPDGGEPR